MLAPVSPERIQIARDYGLANVPSAAKACREAGIPFYVACALLEKESGGNNVWGNDPGGMFSELPSDFRVTESTFRIFEYYVVMLGRQSNGVGPTQITWRGFFEDAKKKGLALWHPYDNMIYGFGLLALYRAQEGTTWEDAGTKYNGSKAYGKDFAEKVRAWRKRLDV